MARKIKRDSEPPKQRIMLTSYKIARKAAPVHTGVKRPILRKNAPVTTGRKDSFPIKSTYKRYVENFKTLGSQRKPQSIQMSSNMLTQHFHLTQRLIGLIQATYRQHFFPIAHFLEDFAFRMTRIGAVMTAQDERSLRTLLPNAFTIEHFFEDLSMLGYAINEQIGNLFTPCETSTIMQRNHVDEIFRRALQLLQPGEVRISRRQTRLDVFMTAALVNLNQVQAVFQGLQRELRTHLHRIILQQTRIQKPVQFGDWSSQEPDQSDSEQDQEINEVDSEDSNEDSSEEDSNPDQGREQIMVE